MKSKGPVVNRLKYYLQSYMLYIPCIYRLQISIMPQKHNNTVEWQPLQMDPARSSGNLESDFGVCLMLCYIFVPLRKYECLK